MPRDHKDKIVLIGEGWFWLSDVMAVVPPDHYALPHSIDMLKKPKGNAVVILESVSVPVYDDRSPEELVADIMKNGE